MSAPAFNPHGLHVVSHASDDAWRLEMARSASCEIATIVEMLNREFSDSDGVPRDFPRDLWRGQYLRLRTLTGVAMSAIDDDMADSEGLADQLYGQWLLDPEMSKPQPAEHQQFLAGRDLAVEMLTGEHADADACSAQAQFRDGKPQDNYVLPVLRQLAGQQESFVEGFASVLSDYLVSSKQGELDVPACYSKLTFADMRGGEA